MIYSEELISIVACGHDFFLITKLIAVSSDMLLILSTYSFGRKAIDLGGNNIGDAGAQALAGILQHCTNLQGL